MHGFIFFIWWLGVGWFILSFFLPMYLSRESSLFSLFSRHSMAGMLFTMVSCNRWIAGSDLSSCYTRKQCRNVTYPRRTCAARVRWLGCQYSTSHFTIVDSSHKQYDLLSGQWRSNILSSFLKMFCCKARAPPALYGYHTESCINHACTLRWGLAF